MTGRAQGQPVYFCTWCELPTTHPSRTCPYHREFAPPIPGLDAPYDEGDQIALDLPEADRVHSQADGGRS